VVLVALIALGVIGCFNSVKIRSTAYLDAEFVAALLAVVLLGPLPAICVWLAGEAIYLLLLPCRLQAHLANVASYGLAAIAGSWVLEALAPNGASAGLEPVGWLAIGLAGAVMLCVNFAVTSGIVAIVLDDRPVRTVIGQELIGRAPASAAMIAIGTATALLYMHIGIPALLLFSASVVMPRMAGNPSPEPQPVLALEHSEALPLFADTIASVMNLPSAERLVVRDAASFIRTGSAEAPRGKLSDLSADHRHALVEALLYRGEHWDGRGGRPGAVGGEMIPLPSRILAVADTWARLTTGSSPSMTHGQAVRLLEARAGVHFDPRVVEVAAWLAEGHAFS
jgi:hypothetical protein